MRTINTLLKLFLIILISSVLRSQDNDNPARRFEEFNKERAYPFTAIPENARENAFRQLEQMMHEKNSKALMLASQPEWKNIGPFNVGGRVKSIVIHPTISDIVYIGAAAGGIWKTTDGGSNWNPIFDFENSISFGSLAMDLNHPDTIYAGTGESVNSSTTYLGSGIYRTVDAGVTWQLMGLTQCGAFSKVIVHPKNSNLIFAGATKRGKGLYLSTDAGSSWKRIYDGSVTDVTVNSQSVSISEMEIMIGVDGKGIFYSGDGGNSWVDRNNGIDAGIGRVSVQMAPSAPNIVYALMEISGNGTIYKTTNTGLNWGNIKTGDANFFRSQGFYDNYLVVHPNRSDVVLAGGIDIWRAIDGLSFENVTNGYAGGNVHVDQHCAAFFPGDPNIVYAGNDGGMYKSPDAGTTWNEINNNLQITQFYSLAIDNTQLNRNYGGTQDNGTVGVAGTNQWNIVVGGDGFKVAVDNYNPNILYGSSTPGGQITPFKYNTANGSFQYMQNGLNTADGVWDPPLIQHPIMTDYLFHARVKLYASYTAGADWNVMDTKLNLNGGVYSAIGCSPVNENFVFAGTSSGDVVLTKDLGDTWKTVTNNGLPNRWIKDIQCSNVDSNTAYVVFSGYGTPHVYKTTNAGINWINISGGLPDVPVNALAIHPNNENMLFIGSDIGVFATFDGGNSWFPYGHLMARSPVLDVKFNKYYAQEAQQVLRAATHGRSIWEVPVNTETISSPEINSPAGGELFTSSTNQVISWYGFNPPVKVEYSVNDGIDWSIIAQNVQGTSLLWNNVPNKETYKGRIRVTSQTDLSQVKVSNTFTIMLLSIGSVLQMGGVNFPPYGIGWDGREGLWTTGFASNKLYKLNVDDKFLPEKFITLPADSVFTDISYDKVNNVIYLHRMTSSDLTVGGPTYIYKIDTTGKLLSSYPSPATVYPIGLELVDGKLIVGDRDYKDSYSNKVFFTIDPATGKTLSTTPNSSQITYGPRGLAYDGKQYLYQVVTDFPNGGAIVDSYVQKLDKANLSAEISRLPLESLDGIINARGIDYDPRDKNFWITDYGGNLYKVAGFETKPIPIDVKENSELNHSTNNIIDLKIYPNPISDFGTITFKILGNSGNVKIELIDILGRKIKNLYNKNVEYDGADFINLNTSGLSAGIYNVVVTLDGKQIMTSKIIKSY